MDDTEQAEIDAAWDEALAQFATPDDAVVMDVEEPAADEAAGEDGAEEQEPAAETAQDEAAETPPNTDPEPDPSNDIWANASPEQKAAFDAAIRQSRTLEHRIKSDEGRVSRFQRERDEALRKNAAIASVAGQEDLEAYMASDEYKKDKADYGSDFPSVFKALETLAARDKLFQEQFGQITEDRAAQVSQTHTDWLDREAPDRAALFGRDDFGPWLDTQPHSVREMVQRNWNEVIDPAEMKVVCDLFRPYAFLADKRNEPAPEPQPRETDRRRDVQLEGSKSHASKAPILTKPDANDEDAAWAEAVASIERKRLAAR